MIRIVVDDVTLYLNPSTFELVQCKGGVYKITTVQGNEYVVGADNEGYGDFVKILEAMVIRVVSPVDQLAASRGRLLS